MKTAAGQLLIFQGALLLAILALAIRRADGEETHFSNMCYRRKPVVEHIKRSKAWQEGQRDVLDWGCGGGALSLALAEQGANKVVAIDIKKEAVSVANQRLKAFPSAIARRPQFGSENIAGFPGRIGYRNQFDIVVSYMGALTDGTCGTKGRKIAAKTAMECAVCACRDNGYVIVAECATLRGLIAPLLTVSLVFFAPNLLMDLNWWQLSLLSLHTDLIGRDPFVPWVGRNIARSFALQQWRLSSIVWSSILFYNFIASLWHQWKRSSKLRNNMKSAGLSNIKVTRRPCYHVTEVLKATDLSEQGADALNKMYYPGMVVIYQGRKEQRKEEQ